jgi:hypothetical protein
MAPPTGPEAASAPKRITPQRIRCGAILSQENDQRLSVVDEFIARPAPLVALPVLHTVLLLLVVHIIVWRVCHPREVFGYQGCFNNLSALEFQYFVAPYFILSIELFAYFQKLMFFFHYVISIFKLFIYTKLSL